MSDQPDNDTDTDAATLSADDADGQTFDAEYVKKLRGEAAKHRQRATDAEAQLEELKRFRLERLLADHAGEVLADVGDLATFGKLDDIYDEDGKPDGNRIKAAAEALAKDRPHLRNRASIGSADGGARTSSQPSRGSDFSDMLRNASSSR